MKQCMSSDSEEAKVKMNMYEKEVKKLKRAFIEAFRTWMQTGRNVKTTLRTLCSEEKLNELKQNILNAHDAVRDTCEAIKLHCAAPTICQKTDACTIMTTELCGLVDKYQVTMVETRLENEDQDERPVGETEIVEGVKESASTDNPGDQEKVGEIVTGEEMVTEFTSPDDPTGQEMVGESVAGGEKATESTSPDDPAVQKKRLKKEPEPPKERFPLRSGASEEGSRPALPPAEMKSPTILPPVPFEATCPGPPNPRLNPKRSMSYKPLCPSHAF